MYRLKQDLKFGKEKELEVLEILEEYFKDDIVLINQKYCTYDYKGIKNIYELKSRRCLYNTYETTIIGRDKIKENMIFIFSFIDGIYYIKYNELKFDKYEYKLFKRYDRGTIDKEKDYLFIPIKDLIKII
jgi:hypothetical protein